jgi:hypothetical protein
MSKERGLYIPPTKTLVSPDDEEVQFTIKRATNAEHLARENMFAKIRYFERSQEDGGEMVSEREFPYGSMKLETVLLCLTGWNLTLNGDPAPLSRDNVIKLLSPQELNFLYEAVVDFNPLWQKGGEKNSEKSSESK